MRYPHILYILSISSPSSEETANGGDESKEGIFFLLSDVSLNPQRFILIFLSQRENFFVSTIYTIYTIYTSIQSIESIHLYRDIYTIYTIYTSYIELAPITYISTKQTITTRRRRSFQCQLKNPHRDSF